MAARKKSASRRSAAKAKSKAAKPKAKKVAKKKTARKVVKKKVAARPKKPARRAARPAPPSPELASINQRIAIVRNNLRDLTEQAAATSGSGSEDALSDRIASQEAELERLSAEREALAKG